MEGVEVETVSNNLKIAQQARSNDLSTRFSLPYATAAAIVHGHTRPEAFVPDRRVAGLAQRVEVRSPDLEDAWPDAAPARVTVRTRNATYTQRVDNPRGHYSNPASADELRGSSSFRRWGGCRIPVRAPLEHRGGGGRGLALQRMGVKTRPGCFSSRSAALSPLPPTSAAQLSRAGGQRPVGLSSEAGEIAEIVAADVKRVPSRAVTPADTCALAHEIENRVGEGCEGVVVTHGTDTMEETAYALALQLDLAVPVVLTGAMRMPAELGADGPANLLNALRVAATPDAGRLGPVIVMHEEIHLARWATKVHTSRVVVLVSRSRARRIRGGGAGCTCMPPVKRIL